MATRLSLEMLADYECPECGELDLDWFTEDEATMVFGGDANGVMRCPNDDCDEELELTLGASLDQMRMIVERMPDDQRGHPGQAQEAGQLAECGQRRHGRRRPLRTEPSEDRSEPSACALSAPDAMVPALSGGTR